jgi:hypothetical protein
LTALWKVREQFGAEDEGVDKLLFYRNRDYVTVSGEDCHATLLRHPENGVLALVSNLASQRQDVTVQFHLDKLRLKDANLRAYHALENAPIDLNAKGHISLDLDPLQWKYVWLRPRVCCGG